jgi:iron complex outermembrane receptor protein
MARFAILALSSITSLAISQAAHAQAAVDQTDKKPESPAAQAQTQPTPAQAQTQPTPEESGQLEEIVVTAQRREESAQRVPISLQTFSSDTLDQLAVRNTEDLTSLVGGMVIQPTAARPAIFLRGVGTNSANTTPAVLTFIDGVYYPFGQSTDFRNVSRVEVLKGPQGTLFGRNATGGVIQITTVSPSETPRAEVELGYGNYETLSGSGYVTGGLARGVAMDLAVNYSHQNDGFGTNVFNGDDVFFTKRFGARSRLLVNFSDATRLTIGGDYQKVRGTVGANVSPAFGYDSLFVAGALRFRGPGQFWPGDYDVNAGPVTPGYQSKEWGINGTLESEFSNMTFRSITAYRESRETIDIDFDGGPAPGIILTIVRVPRTAFTQELQLLSANDGPFQWVAGLFYFNMKAETSPFHLDINVPAVPAVACGGVGVTPIPCDRQVFSVDKDKSIAAYGQGTYAFGPSTRLTVGARYTIEKREIDGNVLVNGVNDPNREGGDSQKFKEPTWRVALDHNFTPNVMAYASVSRGFNAGLFNQISVAGFRTPAQNPPVSPEFLTAWELGTKAGLLGKRLRINLSGFLYNYSDLQQQIYDAGAVVTINAAKARIKGLDLEITARPVRSLTLSVAGTLLDAEYKSYPAAPDYRVQANGSIIAVGSTNAAGNKIVNAPKWSWTASASHDLETSIGQFTTSANLNYRGETFVDPLNRFPLSSRYVFDATERWTHPNGRYFASLWVKNLFDKQYDYAINILTPAGLVGNPAPPRTFGATVGFSY